MGTEIKRRLPKIRAFEKLGQIPSEFLADKKWALEH